MAELDGTEYCSNCKRDIAKNNFVMHEIHCRRNIILCDKCDEPVPRSEVAEHHEEYHALVKCPLCSNEVEVSVLDEHKAEKCGKRPTLCQFCELELPVCDIEEHHSYCGTRTEQCPSCGTFVMKKDQDSHVGEQCLAIQASAASSTRNNLSNNVGASGNDMISDDFHNRFAMDELSRMLNMARTRDVPNYFGGASANDHGDNSPLSRPIDRTSRSISTDSFYGSEVSQRTTIKPKKNNIPNRTRTNNIPGVELNNTSSTSTHRRVAPRTTINSIQRSKRTNEQGHGVTSTRITRSNLQSSHSNSVGDGRAEDLDRLLAMHLAEDLNGTSELNEFSGTEYNSPSERLNINNAADYISDNVFSGDLELPCEFCGNQLPVQMLYEHQTGCDLNPSTSSINHNIFPQETATDSALHNNLASRHVRRTNNSSPNVVDNLGYLAATDLLNSDTVGSGRNTGDEDIMLPCEFCDNLFPEDVIIQHQVVCDANLTLTPRKMSPVLTSGTNRRNTRRRSPGSHDAVAIGSTRRRHQEPPIAFGSKHYSVNTNTGASSSFHPERRNTLTKRSNIPPNPSHVLTQSYADRGMNRRSGDSYFARALAEDSSHLENYEIQRGGSRTEQRRRNSAARIRETLDQLVQDSSTHTNAPSYTGANSRMSKEQKSMMNQTTRRKDNSTIGSGTRGVSTRSNLPSRSRPGYELSTKTTNTAAGRHKKSSMPATNTESGPNFQINGVSHRVTRSRQNGPTSTRIRTRSSSQHREVE